MKFKAGDIFQVCKDITVGPEDCELYCSRTSSNPAEHIRLATHHGDFGKDYWWFEVYIGAENAMAGKNPLPDYGEDEDNGIDHNISYISEEELQRNLDSEDMLLMPSTKECPYCSGQLEYIINQQSNFWVCEECYRKIE